MGWTSSFPEITETRCADGFEMTLRHLTETYVLVHVCLQESDGLTKSTKTYKGVHFGKLTAKRSDFTGKLGPGPGDYEPYVEYQMRPENLNAKDEPAPVRYEAHIPRYNDQIIKEEEKKVCMAKIPTIRTPTKLP